jgi:prophage regulatory protein
MTEGFSNPAAMATESLPRVSITTPTTMPIRNNSALPLLAAGDAPCLLARLPVVLKVTGLARTTIYRWVAAGRFPAPVRLGPRAVAWRWSDLERWTQSRAIERD